jgi:acetyl-CoA C-acetyltransferase
MTREAFIFDAIRTPRGKGKPSGALYSEKPVRLAAGLLNAHLDRSKTPSEAYDDVILGCVSPVGEQGANIAKTAALLAGWDATIAGMTLNRFCASGLEAINIAAAKVIAGWQDFIVAGGVESMSRVPMGSDGGAWALDPECNLQSHFVPQGISADLIASLAGFTREELDQFAAESHRKASQAWERQAFARSIIPVTNRNGEVLLDRDELIRPDANLESLGQLSPAFAQMGEVGFDEVALNRYHQLERIHHRHTAGNSSGIVDGAALLAIGTEQTGQRWGLTPRARIVSSAVVSTEPTIMLTGPAPAARKALEIANLTLDDIDLFEVNEAFAAVVLKFIRELDVDPTKINVNGGAIAMGHPLGATGAILMGTLLDELEARSQRYGLATLCVGGGMGVATIIERL